MLRIQIAGMLPGGVSFSGLELNIGIGYVFQHPCSSSLRSSP